MLLKTEQRDVSSTKSLQSEDTPFDPSLMSIRNNNGPKIEPWGTPALTFSQYEFCPFKTTRCLRQYRKSHKVLTGFQRYHLCHTLSKALIYQGKFPSLQVRHQAAYIFCEW